MISIGKPGRTGQRADGNSRPPAPAASKLASEPDSTGRPGPARPRPAHRQVAVIVDGSPDGSPESAPALRQAASQARQRNATLDVICLLPEQADERTVTMARVRLGELSRRACPLGAGVPVRFRVEHGDVDTMLPVIQADSELLVYGLAIEAEQIAPGPARAPAAASPQRAPRPRREWLRTVLHATS
jgi:Universal stress protein family